MTRRFSANLWPTQYVRLGSVATAPENMEESARSFEEAITLDPTSDDAMVGAASAYELLGKRNRPNRPTVVRSPLDRNTGEITGRWGLFIFARVSTRKRRRCFGGNRPRTR